MRAVHVLDMFLPFSNQFLTQDSMLAAQAINTGVWWLQVLGWCGWAYLVFLHLYMLSDFRGLGMELFPSYVSVLMVKPQKDKKQQPSSNEVKISKYQKVMGLLYAQTKPEKQQILLIEDGPQALLATAMALGGHLSKFTALLNLILPASRLLASWLFHDTIARNSLDWLLYEAWKAEAAGQHTLCELKVHGLERAFPKELLEVGSNVSCFTPDLWKTVIDDLGVTGVLTPGGRENPLSNLLNLFILAQHEVLQLNSKEESKRILDRTWHFLILRFRDKSLRGEFLVRVPLRYGLRKLNLDSTGHFHFGDEGLGDAGTVALAKGLANNGTLKELHLYQNSIGDAGVKALASALETNCVLKELILKDNPFGDAGVIALAKALEANKSLEKLDVRLYHKTMGVEALKALASALEVDATLKKLIVCRSPKAEQILGQFKEQGRVDLYG